MFSYDASRTFAWSLESNFLLSFESEMLMKNFLFPFTRVVVDWTNDKKKKGEELYVSGSPEGWGAVDMGAFGSLSPESWMRIPIFDFGSGNGN